MGDGDDVAAGDALRDSRTIAACDARQSARRSFRRRAASHAPAPARSACQASPLSCAQLGIATALPLAEMLLDEVGLDQRRRARGSGRGPAARRRRSPRAVICVRCSGLVTHTASRGRRLHQPGEGGRVAALAGMVGLAVAAAVIDGDRRVPHPPPARHRRPCRRRQQHRDLAALLDRAEHVAGVAADLALRKHATRRHHERRGDQRGDARREMPSAKSAITSAMPRPQRQRPPPSGAPASAPSPSLRAGASERMHQRQQRRAPPHARRSARRATAPPAAMRGERRGAQAEAEDQRHHAVGADAAVAHDRELVARASRRRRTRRRCRRARPRAARRSAARSRRARSAPRPAAAAPAPTAMA